MAARVLRDVIVWTLAGRAFLCAHGLGLERTAEDGIGKVNVALTLKVDDQPVLQRLFENLDKAMTVGDLKTALSSSRTWAPDTGDAAEDDTDSSEVHVAIIADATEQEVEDEVTLNALLDRQQQQQPGSSAKEGAAPEQVEQKEGGSAPLFKQGFLQSLPAITRSGGQDALKLTSIINGTALSKNFWKMAFSTFNFFNLADTFSQNGRSKMFRPKLCFCPLIKAPVCGVDGVTYNNLCLMKCKQVKLKHAGSCRDVEAKVPRKPATPGECKCPFIDQPVCGADGKTYANKCVLTCLGKTLAHDGKCPAEEENPQGVDPECKCSSTDEPVCGVNAKTYKNSCFMTCANVELRHPGPCTTDELSERCNCTEELAPVCGRDGNSYRNKCLLKCENVEFKHDGSCHTPDKNCDCTFEYNPLCAVDGKTYANECLLQCSGIGLAHKGECAPGQTVSGAPLCSSDDDPVCGTDGITYLNDCWASSKNVQIERKGKCVTGGAEACTCPETFAPVCGVDGMTYKNSCQLDCANVRLAASGKCTDELCKCPKAYDPVCGADGVTYGNPCYLRCNNARLAYKGPCREVTAVPQIAARALSATPEFPQDEEKCKCPAVYVPVCGQDGQTYNNLCELDCADVEFAYSGECESEDPPCECPRTWAPVCATNGKTYPNLCLLNYDGAVLKHVGKCTKKESAKPFKQSNCVCERDLEVICGADGETYANRCYMKCSGTKFFHHGHCAFETVTRESCALDTGRPCECPEVLAPVCGVDNKTYKNECELDCKCVAMKSSGKCAAEQETKCACPNKEEPVCGFDNRTYQNECKMKCANATLRHRGPCSNTKQPESVSPSPKTCVCPLGHDIVCGTDGRTYANACIAKCDRIGVRHPGKCTHPWPREPANIPCNCLLHRPVCGVDGKTYFNKCNLQDKGIELAHYGFCASPSLGQWKCGEPNSHVCATNNKTYPNDCLRHQDGAQLMFQRPCHDTAEHYVCSCPGADDPVCGRDGKTYRNACEMECRYVELDHQGTCSCPCPRILDPICGSDGKTYDNECDLHCVGGIVMRHFGICVEGEDAAENCPDTVQPVCGTNGKTYANDCLRYRDDAILLERDVCSDVDSTEVVVTQEKCSCPVNMSLVCGKDGNTYINGCVMDCAQVDLAHKGRCPSKTPTRLCPCPRVLDPVCGGDGKTYNNKCLMECEGVTMRYFGKCVEGGEARNGCPTTGEPVCGANRKTYANDCLRYLDNIALLKRGLCYDTDLSTVVVTLENCTCPAEIDMICGENGKTYLNACVMNCAGVQRAYKGKCVPETQSNLCPCPRVLDPVCGSDGKTYNNKCLMECEGVAMRYFGRCVEGGEATKGCPETVEPVCGTNGKTYANDCSRYLDGVALLQRDICHNLDFSDVVATVQGCSCAKEMDLVCGKNGITYLNECVMKCADVELAQRGMCASETSSNFCACRRIRDPVCGSDGKTYQNKCLMECKGVTMRYFGRCVEGGEVDKACPDTVAPVCGTNGQTYANDCLRYRDRAILYKRDFCRDINSTKPISMVQNCPCPSSTDLVCGRDGRTYTNKCIMSYAGVSPAYKGKCRTGGAQTPSEPKVCPCPGVLDPACGSDGKTYNNKCLLECEGVEMLHHGRCAEGGKNCPTVVEPVCSTSGKTYENDCVRFLDGAVLKERRKCSRGTTIVSAKDVFCKCRRVPKPVCGRDGNTYISSCEMECRQVKMNHTGKCLESHNNPQPAGDPYSACTLAYRPVCGENGLTYANRCLLDAQKVAFKFEGPCQVDVIPPADQPVCRCPRHYRPVCGVDGKTYPNTCVLECYDVSQEHEGQCQDKKPEMPAPEPPVCRCPRHYRPVCGEDGKTYANSCLMECNNVAIKHYGKCIEHAKGKKFP